MRKRRDRERDNIFFLTSIPSVFIYSSFAKPPHYLFRNLYLFITHLPAFTHWKPIHPTHPPKTQQTKKTITLHNFTRRTPSFQPHVCSHIHVYFSVWFIFDQHIILLCFVSGDGLWGRCGSFRFRLISSAPTTTIPYTHTHNHYRIHTTTNNKHTEQHTDTQPKSTRISRY